MLLLGALNLTDPRSLKDLIEFVDEFCCHHAAIIRRIIMQTLGSDLVHSSNVPAHNNNTLFNILLIYHCCSCMGSLI